MGAVVATETVEMTEMIVVEGVAMPTALTVMTGASGIRAVMIRRSGKTRRRPKKSDKKDDESEKGSDKDDDEGGQHRFRARHFERLFMDLLVKSGHVTGDTKYDELEKLLG